MVSASHHTEKCSSGRKKCSSSHRKMSSSHRKHAKMQLISQKNAKKIDMYQASLIMRLVISFYTEKNRKRASQVMKTGLHLLKYTEERHCQASLIMRTMIQCLYREDSQASFYAHENWAAALHTEELHVPSFSDHENYDLVLYTEKTHKRASQVTKNWAATFHTEDRHVPSFSDHEARNQFLYREDSQASFSAHEN